MDRELSEDEVERLLTALDQLVDQGDLGAARVVIWISHVLATTQAGLRFDQRTALAELAGRAAQRSGTPSLAALAGRLLDPVLWTVGRGDEELEPEYLEYLNDIRRRIVKLTARHSL
jgi:hypothetical protein